MITSAVAKGRCPVCRAPSCGCGPDTSGIVPIDQPAEEDAMAGELKEYEVVMNGITTTMQLNEKDAQRLGASEVKAKPKKAAANKKRTSRSDKE